MLEEKPLVSVIVPCYNAERTLRRCLDSILNQTYENLEVLVIDDGSVDESRAILQYYEKKDERIRFIASSHQGVSHARNMGLWQAGGKYLQFVDADDYLLGNCTGVLVHEIQNRRADWVICDYLQIQDSEKKSEPERRERFKNASDCRTGADDGHVHFAGEGCSHVHLAGEGCGHVHLAGGVYRKRIFLRKLLRHPNAHYYGVLWNKLYRKQLIDEAGVRFDGAVSMGEDFMFNMEYVSLIQTVCCLDEPLYGYRWKQEGSLSNRYKQETERISEQVRMYHAYRKMFQREKLYIPWRYGILYYMVKYYFDELEALGEDAPVYKEFLYEQCIRNNHISKMEFAVYCILKKGKQAWGGLKR